MGGTVRGEQERGAGEEAAGSPRRARTGPRHAAPKKSVLTRLQLPAGKAIALAAMPTAVLMGMGLTPQLANASPRGADGFKPGPCVTQSDEPDQGDQQDKATSDTSENDKPGDDKDKAGTSGGSTAKPSASPSPTPTPQKPAPEQSEPAKPDPEPAPTQPSEPTEPSTEPSTGESTNPLDPLGLGEKLEDLLGGGDDDEQPAEPSASPSPTPTPTTKPSDSDAKSPADQVDKATDDAAKTAEDATDTAKDTTDKATETADKAKDTADKATPKPSPSASSEPGADGKEGYPCPTFDADAYNNAKADRAEALLPEDPWILKSSRLGLHGLKYDGIVEVKTQSGKVKKVLKFRASGVDIDDLHQLVKGPGGSTQHVEARKGSRSTIRNGEVTMYTEELSGKLLGLIPVTFTPKAPPPLTLPELFFTDVTVIQAGQFGGDLTVPGMHGYPTYDD
ncbi:hydrogenase expression protein HypF [Streptomyces sp. XD-27]|uniref:hydrogenase expression protein HypF n=1 Tax=Streptomyces sp. XD-27 TaxID=3062779 RepID=UPI0026F4400B|nr:hydrogenase expression protein HypF [Streptomyces sp. XD-27]WKX72673.1 hydrogenase expression protein HypF [Streptomyces sp. XD-27]